MTASDSSVDGDEVARFSRMAEAWWDAEGPFRPLHQINHVRLAYIRDRLSEQFDRDAMTAHPLSGLRVADIGCGGGLLCEPMRRLGAEVVGVDPSEENVAIARHHAAALDLDIDYVQATAEDLVTWGEKFDVVLNMEVIEHVGDVPNFLKACAGLLRSHRSCMTVATLNRTMKAYLLAIVGAEYVLRWLPRGTHDWNRFVKPSELQQGLTGVGLRLADIRGMSYAPLSQTWRLSRDVDANYLAFAVNGRR